MVEAARTPVIGSEAVASGHLSRYTLRSRYCAIHPDVYVPRDARLTAVTRARAAWLWSRRRGVLTGRSAAALHGTKWIDAQRPAEICYDNRRPPAGIRTRADRLADDEVEVVGGMAVTTPVRTAFDVACRYPTDPAVVLIDALARATRLKMADVDLLVQRYPGHRGIRHARVALNLVDPGAQSPRETWLRLLLIRAGFPRPQTQIPVYDNFGVLVAVVDMGWEGLKVATDYEGEHHRTDPRQFRHDIYRLEAISQLGWVNVRVTAEDTCGGIIGRIAAAGVPRQ